MQRAEEEVTTDYELASTWAAEFLGSPNVANIWIPSHAFIKAVRTNSSLTFARAIIEDAAGSEGGKTQSRVVGQYALAFGTPRGSDSEDGFTIDPEWTGFSLPRETPRELTSSFQLGSQWDVYGAATSAFATPGNPARGGEAITVENHFGDAIATIDVGVNQSDDMKRITPKVRDEISSFLNEHAPTSSTYPDSDEVIAWVVLRDGAGRITAVAAITRWESGGVILSSVAVDTNLRGKGLGELVVRESLKSCAGLSISHLLLAVLRKNAAAIALYEKIGFTQMGKFNYFTRINQ